MRKIQAPTDQTRASRATVSPEGDRISGRIVLRFHEPVVHVLGLGTRGTRDIQVTRELVELKVQVLGPRKVSDLISHGLRGIGRDRADQQSERNNRCQHFPKEKMNKYFYHRKKKILLTSCLDGNNL